MEQKHNNDKATVQDLMIRSITFAELTAEEQAQLQSWLALNAGNRQEYEDLIAVKNLFEADGSAKPNTDAAWKKVKARIDVPPAHVRKTASLKWLKYAAVILVVLLAGILLYQTHSKQDDNELLTKVIKPGGHHAELVLPDGKRVKLEEEKTVNISGGKNMLVASNKNNTLVYNANTGQQGYHRLIVPDGGQYEIILPDKSHVWINSGSELTYRVDFKNAPLREIRLVGEAYFKVAKDKKHPFIVKTDHMDVEAVGTAFNVSAYKNAAYAEATLVEGIVNVSDRMGNKQQMLAGARVRITGKKQNVLPVLEKTVTTYNDYAWKDGMFVFDNMPLEQITAQIARWYNVKIEFNSISARQLRFTGSIEKDKTLNTVLKLISTSAKVSFELRNGTLYITKS
jgi:ferric-dicitrate binding protein FerR (iron transport regulator)